MISKRQWLKVNDSLSKKISWEKGMWVKITKLAEHPDAVIPACPKECFTPGQPHLLSLPVEYCVEGYLLTVPEVGSCLSLDRRVRNGVPALGIFYSSEIQEIHGNRIATMNSTYMIECKDNR